MYTWALNMAIHHHQRHSGLFLRFHARAPSAPKYRGLLMHNSRYSHWSLELI